MVQGLHPVPSQNGRFLFLKVKILKGLLLAGTFALTLIKLPIVSITAYIVFIVLLVRFIKSPTVLRILSFFLLIYLLELITSLELIPSYLLPSPAQIGNVIISQRDVILPNLISTLEITFAGFALSIVFGIVFALIMHLVKPVEALIYPIAVISQSTPTIAIAPLIILWFGFGSFSKIGVVIWATFFPITVNTLLGLRTVDPDMVDVLTALGAKRLDIFRYVILPHTLSYIITGIEITSPYAILGALTAEWMGTTEGMGLYIRRSFSSFRLDQVFAGTIIIIIFSLLMWGGATLLRQRFTRYMGGNK